MYVCINQCVHACMFVWMFLFVCVYVCCMYPFRVYVCMNAISEYIYVFIKRCLSRQYAWYVCKCVCVGRGGGACVFECACVRIDFGSYILHPYTNKGREGGGSRGIKKTQPVRLQP